MKKNQTSYGNQEFHGVPVRFLCGDWEMESHLRQKSVILGLKSGKQIIKSRELLDIV
jgi:hypothetical protein